MNAPTLIAAARRFLLLLVAIAALTSAFSLALGELLGASARRSISLGLYLVGSFLLAGGFLTGNPRPLRRIENDRGFFRGPREIRRSTVEERQDAIGASATYIAIGVLVIMLGIVADQRTALF